MSKKITLDRAYMLINGRLDRTLTAYLFHKKIPSSDRVVHISIRRENTAPPAAPRTQIKIKLFFFARNRRTPDINPKIPQLNI